MKSCIPVMCWLAMAVGSAAVPQPIQFPNPGPNQGQGQGFNAGQQGPGQGQQGGGANADFESLIELIISTVAPDTWADNGGGDGDIRPFVGGVYADTRGLFRRVRRTLTGTLSEDLAAARSGLLGVRERAAAAQQPRRDDPRGSAILRCISLTRLERELDRRLTAGEPLDQAMLALAGLRRVQYVLFLGTPDGASPTEVVLAGPAGDWRTVGDGRIVATDSGASIVRLDDLLTLLRRPDGGAFGCSINPREESLAAAQAFLNRSAGKPVSPRRRERWVEQLRDAVGLQDIEVFGVDPTSRVAGVLVEADHHMKLVGMGLAEGVLGVESYLDALAKQPEASTASTGVLRWWFAMHYAAVMGSPDGRAFELRGAGAKVLSEKQLLTARGERVAAGAGDPLAEGFASSFTTHFAELCRKHPVYSELRNVFDLALAVEIIRAGRQEQKVSWRPTLFADAERMPLPAYEPAQTVETVVNHRVVDRRRFVAGVSGGVWTDARRALAQRRQTADGTGYGPLGEQPVVVPDDLAERHWWWDVEN